MSLRAEMRHVTQAEINSKEPLNGEGLSVRAGGLENPPCGQGNKTACRACTATVNHSHLGCLLQGQHLLHVELQHPLGHVAKHRSSDSLKRLWGLCYDREGEGA